MTLTPQSPYAEIRSLLKPYSRQESIPTHQLVNASIDRLERLKKDAVYRAAEFATHGIGWQHFVLPQTHRTAADGLTPMTDITAKVTVLTPAQVERITHLLSVLEALMPVIPAPISREEARSEVGRPWPMSKN